MSVNDNDRVTSRRLKQFWDLAKPWIQTLVSGAINTSEAAMESSMDTKILAAKPDYTKPNIDGQIGDGFGYNDVRGFMTKWSSNPTIEYLPSMVTNGQELSGFIGNVILGTQLKYFFSQFTTADSSRIIAVEHLLKAFAGKMVAVPHQIIGTDELQTDFVNNLDNFKSIYLPDEQCLLSPIYNFEGNTYQTKFKKRPNYATYEIAISVNGSEFETNYTNNVGWHNDAIAWCVGLNNMPFDIGSCDVPKSGINSDKLADSSVSGAKLTSDVYNKLCSAPLNILAAYERNADDELELVYPVGLIQTLVHYTSPTGGTAYFNGISGELYYGGVFKTHLDSGGNSISHGSINTQSNYMQIRAALIKSNVRLRTVTGYPDRKYPYYCALIVKKQDDTIHYHYGKITDYPSNQFVKIEPIDPNFFNIFNDDDDFLIIQSFYYPNVA